jgi:RNA polymerase sigma-70 factor (ECF subfamily)
MKNLSYSSDSDLLRLMQAGDEEAFVALYRRRQNSVYRFALQMSGFESVAEDVTQEVFITLLQEPNRYDESRGSLTSFLYGVARKKILQKLRRESRLLSLFDDEKDYDENFVSDVDPLRDLTRDETIKAVQQAVLALPQHYREVVVLCDLHELSYAETAEIVGCAVGTVRSRLHRARGLLIEKLELKKIDATELETANQKRCYA